MNLRKTFSGVALSTFTALTSPGAEAHPDVKVFVQTRTIRESTGEILSSKQFCNFSLVNIQGKAKFMTARHCIDEKTKSLNSSDIVVLDSLPAGSRHEDISDAHIHEASPYTGKIGSGKTFKITGFLPMAQNHNTRKQYTISGEGRYNPRSGEIEMSISKKDFESMLQSMGRECKDGNYYLSGMSGSIVFDDQNRAFGVVSTNEAICSKDDKYPIIWVNNKNTYYAITVAPLQDYLSKNK